MTIICGATRFRDRGKQSDRSIEKITEKVRVVYRRNFQNEYLVSRPGHFTPGAPGIRPI